MTTYFTTQGETFDMIALKCLGDEHLEHRIMEANYAYHTIRIFSGGIALVIPQIMAKRRIELVPWKEAVEVP